MERVTEVQSILSLRGITKRFGGLAALNQVDLEIVKGERVGLLGPNGAGKTTLTNVVCGDLRATAGEQVFMGETVGALKPHRRFKAGLARTYQVANPFPSMTALESASLGALVHTKNVSAAQEIAFTALERLDLGGLATTRMDGLNIVEMKKVELARIMASDPAVVFLDEVLAGLRPTEVSAVLDVLEEVASDQKWTVVMIEHLVGAVMRFCPRLVVMTDGTVIADGPAQSVAEDDRVIEAYLGAKGRRDVEGA